MGQQMYVHEGGLMSPWPKYKNANLIILCDLYTLLSLQNFMNWAKNWSCTPYTLP